MFHNPDGPILQIFMPGRDPVDGMNWSFPTQQELQES